MMGEIRHQRVHRAGVIPQAIGEHTIAVPEQPHLAVEQQSGAVEPWHVDERRAGAGSVQPGSGIKLGRLGLVEARV